MENLLSEASSFHSDYDKPSGLVYLLLKLLVCHITVYYKCILLSPKLCFFYGIQANTTVGSTLFLTESPFHHHLLPLTPYPAQVHPILLWQLLIPPLQIFHLFLFNLRTYFSFSYIPLAFSGWKASNPSFCNLYFLPIPLSLHSVACCSLIPQPGID